jgi:hypothetical protein
VDVCFRYITLYLLHGVIISGYFFFTSTSSAEGVFLAKVMYMVVILHLHPMLEML